MKIKPRPTKQREEIGHWVNGVYTVQKQRSMGRLAQLGKAFLRRHDSEAVETWKRMDA